MVNKSYFLILLTLIIFALIYIIREKRILADNVSVILEELEEDAPEYRSKEKKLSLTKISYTEGLLEGQLYSFFGTGDLTSRNLSENQVKDIILERISERELHNYQNIEKNFVRTRRWPYNKKWFIGKLVIKLVKIGRVFFRSGRFFNPETPSNLFDKHPVFMIWKFYF